MPQLSNQLQPKVVIMRTLSPLVMSWVVMTKNPGAISDDKVGIVTSLKFQELNIHIAEKSVLWYKAFKSLRPSYFIMFQ